MKREGEAVLLDMDGMSDVTFLLSLVAFTLN